MRVLFYFQSDPAITGDFPELNKSLVEKGHEVRYSTEDIYRDRQTLLLNDIRHFDFVLFVTDLFFPRKRDTFVNPRVRRLHHYRQYWDAEILALLARRTKSAVLDYSGHEFPDYLESPRMKLYLGPYLLRSIVEEIDAQAANNLQLSDNFDAKFRELYKAAKSIKRRRLVFQFHEWLTDIGPRIRRAWEIRQLISAIYNPTGYAAERLGNPGDVEIMLNRLHKLDELDPNWRNSEKSGRRYARLSNWLCTQDLGDLQYDSPYRSDVKWFSENYPKDVVSLLNGRRAPLPEVEYRAKDTIRNRSQIRSWIKAESDVSLERFDTETCKVIEKHPFSINYEIFQFLLLEQDAAEWHLTPRTSELFQKMLNEWPDGEIPDSELTYEERDVGRDLWDRDVGRFQAAKTRCLEAWTRRSENAQ